MFTENICIHQSWDEFLQDREYLRRAEKDLINNCPPYFTPPAALALRFLSLDLSSVKIIIIGQDPYPQPNIATGRAFEALVNSWREPIPQTSLRNILRALYAAYNGQPQNFSFIREEIIQGRFNILPPCELFENWEKQGVLLLNTTFTCEIGRPGSHIALWREFSEKLMRYISKTDAIWFLWGNHAKKYAPYAKTSYICGHPMTAGGRNPNDFFDSKCFHDTKEIVNWLGRL